MITVILPVAFSEQPMSALPVIALFWLVLTLVKLILTPPPNPPKKTPEEKLSDAIAEFLKSRNQSTSVDKR